MTKLLRWFAAVCLTLFAGVGLAACGDDDEDPVDTNSPSQEEDDMTDEGDDMTDDTSEDMTDEGDDMTDDMTDEGDDMTDDG